MNRRSLEKLRDEIRGLMLEHIESLKTQTFVGLDEEGLRLMAAALCAEARTLDEDDLGACGAFVGEVFRKRFGGQWTGYDENYRLEITLPETGANLVVLEPHPSASSTTRPEQNRMRIGPFSRKMSDHARARSHPSN